MKQLVKNLRTGETIIADVPIPKPGPGTALIRTSTSLISAGTERMVAEFAEKSLVGKARSRPDLVKQAIDKARREGLLSTLSSTLNRLDQPLPLGYSSAGTIVGLGKGIEGFRTGQRVACAGGGYAVHAEYNIVPNHLLATLPDKVDFESAAFATLGAIVLHGFRLSEAQLGENVAIIGLGLLGLLAVGIGQAAGCHVLGIDLDPSRVELARSLGAKAALREGADNLAQAFSGGLGCDAILICADTPSSDPVELAGNIARDRARVVALGAVGLQIPRKTFYEKELSFINSRSYGPGRYDTSYEEKGHDYPIGYVRWTEGRNLEAFVGLLASGKVNVSSLITHRFPIHQAISAYELITGKRREPYLGILITYPSVGSKEDIVFQGEKATPPMEESAEPHEPQPDLCKLGVLGAGNFARAILLPALEKIPQLELVSIASGSGLNASQVADRYNFKKAVSDDTQVINDPEVNTIAILTRHHLHTRQVLAALSAGKHIFCEKPLALTPVDLQEIAAILMRSNYWELSKTTEANGSTQSQPFPDRIPLITVGFNRRFAPLAKKLYEFLDQREEPLIAHYRVNAGFLPQTHWLHDPQQGGGRIIGEACHFIDFLTFLVGETPISVITQALPDDGRYNEDNVMITLEFPDGSIGLLTYVANGDKALAKERLEVFTSGRVAILDDFRSLETIQDGKRKVYRSRFRQDKGHLAEWQAFVSAIIYGGCPPIPYQHLVGVTQASFAAVDSLHRDEKISLASLSFN
jgi:predicted dehydrogenase/threonine dehydrogenase-like Zn-dependent dehydrogenase